MAPNTDPDTHMQDYHISSTFYHTSEYRASSRSISRPSGPLAHSLALSYWKIHNIQCLWTWLCKFIAGFWIIKLPAEVREMIFELVFKEQVWDGNSVALVAALRPDPGLYREVLYLFFKQESSVFRIWMGNLNRLLKTERSLGMGVAAARGVQRLEITCGVVTMKQVKRIFGGGATFTHVALKFSFTKAEVENTLISWILTLLRLSPRLRSITIRHPKHFNNIQITHLWSDWLAEIDQWKIDYQTWKFNNWGCIKPIAPVKPMTLIQYITDRFGVEPMTQNWHVSATPKWTYDKDQYLSSEARSEEWNYKELDTTWEVNRYKVLVWNEENKDVEMKD